MSSAQLPRPSLEEILQGVIEITSEQCGIAAHRLSAASRPVQDLGIDSLDLVEWVMEMEDRFDVKLPDPSQVGDQVYKQVFTRGDFSLRDMVELIHLRWGSGAPARAAGEPAPLIDFDRAGFAQLGGRADGSLPPESIYEEIGQDAGGRELLRRRTDGMLCVVLPGGLISVGHQGDEAGADERPVHQCHLSRFVVDLELVSTTAYCRFLNSVECTDVETIRQWFLLQPEDRRRRHEVVRRTEGAWRPLTGTEEWPMILVSWHGARAYARWAHGHDPLDESGPSFLPTEAQWEYSVLGRVETKWPWGDDAPGPGFLRAGRARVAAKTDRLPLGPVHALDHTSDFGLRGALGHVWQWCDDWYSSDTYARRAHGLRDPVETQPTGVRSERGGSWVGAVSLCRPSYRRGRVGYARGRCLGFRCAAPRP